jgi:2-desacetyl-2-hydroxyethyl bacteriochlorophyllide A dehydrogenase
MTQTRKTAEAFWITGPGHAEIRTETLPAPGPEDVLVATLYSGISRGTETLVFDGEVPTSEYERMRAPFQDGEFPAPVKYGYISVGRVEAGPAEMLGHPVFCLHPHQSAYVVPVSAVQPIPETVPPERAVLAANMETALNGLWDAAPRLGDRVAVVGAGTLGCLSAWLASRIPGCRVELVDINPQRAAVAKALDVGFATPEHATPEMDLVLHCSGHGEGLTTALALAAFEARVIELSWYGRREVTLPLGSAFHARRLQLVSSQVGHIATAQRARWTSSRRMALALELLADARLDVLITGEDEFKDMPEVMARLSQTPGDTLCHRIRYN